MSFVILIGLISILPSFAQESIPEFGCVPFMTTCGEAAIACGFSEAERVQDAAHWENFFCGNP
ncbi:hypothetical protein SAMN04488104_102314 [Algoriphagus faecimaris]|uniref:Uncharacterized protein n=1 Tax=Algoriphagus faecimaris TaxID=686796 RepID=A0A1G6TM28_9BACT|nr:hypothetical protein [Algoriphagus faecimaris]SDD30111.1 hypothetical protein SAMN04488104_102314 [Algoriphagus faecimaris]